MRALLPALLALVIASPVAATDTEADTIRAVYEDWGKEPDRLANAPFLERLDDLYADASLACRNFVSLLFNAFALYDAGSHYSPDNHIGASTGMALLLTNLQPYDYACRIAA